MPIRRLIADRKTFNSTLDPARDGLAAQLRLSLDIALIPYDPANPSSANGYLAPSAGERFRRVGSVNFDETEKSPDNIFPAESWTTGGFATFCRNFKQTVERGWNNQIILLPPEGDGDGEMTDSDFRQFIADRTLPAHLVCSLEVNLVRRLVHSVLIRVAKLLAVSDQSYEAFPPTVHHGLLDDRSLRPRTNQHNSGVQFTQVPAVHEVGHWLGHSPLSPDGVFQHVDFAAAKARGLPPNSEEEYGLTVKRARSIMGMGLVATEHDAGPWMTRARRHTGALYGWRYVHRIQFDSGSVPVSARQKRLLGG